VFRSKGDNDRRDEEAWRQEASQTWHEAKAAHERGDALFGCTFVVSESGGTMGLGKIQGRLKTTSVAPVIASVEELGWHLDKADHVFLPTVTSTLGARGGMSPEQVSGVV
jgi:hypothetical protein